MTTDAKAIIETGRPCVAAHGPDIRPCPPAAVTVDLHLQVGGVMDRVLGEREVTECLPPDHPASLAAISGAVLGVVKADKCEIERRGQACRAGTASVCSGNHLRGHRKKPPGPAPPAIGPSHPVQPAPPALFRRPLSQPAGPPASAAPAALAGNHQFRCPPSPLVSRSPPAARRPDEP